MPLNPSSAPGVVGISTWKTEVMQRALSVNFNLSTIVTNDFETNTASSNITALGGTVTYDTGLTGGVANLRTNVLPSAIAGVYNAGGAALVGNPQTESWYAHSRCQIRSVPTGTTGIAPIGMQDANLTGQYIGIIYSASFSDVFLALAMTTGGAPTSVLMNVPADLNAFHDYAIGRDADNDKIYVLIDASPALELDGPFPALTSLPSLFYSSMQATLLGQDVQMYVDNIANVVERI